MALSKLDENEAYKASSKDWQMQCIVRESAFVRC